MSEEKIKPGESVFKAGRDPQPPAGNKGCLIYLAALGVMLILAAIMTYL